MSGGFRRGLWGLFRRPIRTVLVALVALASLLLIIRTYHGGVGGKAAGKNEAGERSLVLIKDTDDSLVIRTDFSDDLAWERLCAAIREPVGEFRAHVTCVSDPKCSGLKVGQVLDLLPNDLRRSFIFIADEIALLDSEHPILVVDLKDERGRTFRVVSSQTWGVENNLSIANMDFREFADNVDADGVFRGLR